MSVRKVRDLIKTIEADGWYYYKTLGDHHHYKHSKKPGKVTIPGKHSDEVHPKTEKSILRQAGLI